MESPYRLSDYVAHPQPYCVSCCGCAQGPGSHDKGCLQGPTGMQVTVESQISWLGWCDSLLGPGAHSRVVCNSVAHCRVLKPLARVICILQLSVGVQEPSVGLMYTLEFTTKVRKTTAWLAASQSLQPGWCNSGQVACTLWLTRGSLGACSYI